MAEAYAIEDKDGFIDARYIRKWERECWKAMVGNHEEGEFQKRITHLKQHLFSCVPVTVSEKGEAEALLKELKGVFAGDALPHWQLKPATTNFRGRWIDRIDAYLSRGQG